MSTKFTCFLVTGVGINWNGYRYYVAKGASSYIMDVSHSNETSKTSAFRLRRPRSMNNSCQCNDLKHTVVWSPFDIASSTKSMWLGSFLKQKPTSKVKWDICPTPPFLRCSTDLHPRSDVIGNLQFKTCAVVGSSSQHRDVKRGNDIEASDAVFRFSYAPSGG